MHTNSKKLYAVVGGGAIAVAFAVNVVDSRDAQFNNVAGGSGDSSVTGSYVQPVVPAMSLNPTAMSVGSTATAAVPSGTPATSFAAPVLKASPAPGCVNNGQCP